MDIKKIGEIILTANMGDDSISVVDVKNKKETHRIYLDSINNKFDKVNFYLKKPLIGPHSIKIDRIRQNLYSVNCFDDSISIVDLNNCTIKQTFFAGSHPNDMVFNKDESYAYITNGDSDSVSIVDLSNKKIITQIPVGAMPHGICLNSKNDLVYVANMDSNTISIIDTLSNSNIFSIKVEECPIEVITSKDGKFLYVACSYLGVDRNGMISIISTQNNKVLKNIKVGFIPVEMVLSEDERYLFTANMGSNDLYVIDLYKYEVIKKIRVGNMARGVAISDDIIFVSNSEDNNISMVKIDTWQIIYNIAVGAEPTSMLYIKYI